MPISFPKLEKILLTVQKPGRYVGGEFNLIMKDSPLIRMAISYPDLYEVGMSNNGIKIIYEAANSIDDIACERVFSVDLDFEKSLRSNDIPLYTLESFTPLRELDIIGFNISHELLYTNILQILDLGNVPLFRKERENDDPIVIGGGGAVSNPFPVLDFFDAFFIGDGEEGIIDIVQCVKHCKLQNRSRIETLEDLSHIEGVLISANYTFEHHEDKKVSIQGPIVHKRIYSNNKLTDPEKPLVPNIRVTQERAVVEVSRGCINMCKFCHAGFYELPCRMYPHEAVAEKVNRIVNNTGYNEVTLSSLSISDYKDLIPLLNKLLPEFNRNGISISLPSLKVDLATLPIIEAISDVRKTSLTFAIESASVALREQAYKKVYNEDIYEIVQYVSERGWRIIKFYFMLGLPGCEEVDEAEEIITLIKNIIQSVNKKLDINITLSPFVPKPHTPFQKEKMMDFNYFIEAVSQIKRGLPKFVKVKNHTIEASLLEGVLSRGDARLGSVIYGAYRDGARLDSWHEHFSHEIWERNLNALIPGWQNILSQKKEDSLFWQIIKSGKERLIEQKEDGRLDLTNRVIEHRAHDASLNAMLIESSKNEFKKKFLVASRHRFIFSKKGLLKYTSHIEFIEILKRAFRMAHIPIAFSQGFNKRERISAAYPVPLGIESFSEIIDVDLYESLEKYNLQMINSYLPNGSELLFSRTLEPKEQLIQIISAVSYKVVMCDVGDKSAIQKNCNSSFSFKKKTKKSEKILYFDEIVQSIDFTDKEINIVLSVGESGVRIDELISALAEIDKSELYRFSMHKMNQLHDSCIIT